MTQSGHVQRSRTMPDDDGLSAIVRGGCVCCDMPLIERLSPPSVISHHQTDSAGLNPASRHRRMRPTDALQFLSRPTDRRDYSDADHLDTFAVAGDMVMRGGRFTKFEPSPEHIARECAEIRAGWSDAERLSRLRSDQRPEYRRCDGVQCEIAAAAYCGHHDTRQRLMEGIDYD